MKRYRSIPYLWLFMAAVNGAACFGQIRQELWGFALLSGILMLSSLIFAVGDFREVIKK
jgi:hypothetical protein